MKLNVRTAKVFDSRSCRNCDILDHCEDCDTRIPLMCDQHVPLHDDGGQESPTVAEDAR